MSSIQGEHSAQKFKTLANCLERVNQNLPSYSLMLMTRILLDVNLQISKTIQQFA